MAPEQDVLTMRAIEPDLAEADYFAHPALSCSGAKLLLPPNAPAIFKWQQDNPEPPKPAYDEGHAIHALTLGVGAGIERLDFKDRRTNDFKAQDAAARAAGKIPLLAAQHDNVLAMRQSISRHPVAGPLFDREGPLAEASVFWQAEVGDALIDCRARLDWLILEGVSRPIVVDLKSANSASPTKFAKSMADFNYHMQRAHYADGVAAVTNSPDVAFLFVVIEKEPPYLVSVIEPEPVAVYVGQAKMRRAMEIFRDCTASGIWPGYNADPSGIDMVGLPPWADREYL